MSVLDKLTEGIVNRDLSSEGAALLAKWEKTGLLEGITNDQKKNGMAVLLENQAKELLREASSMAAGDVEGFASVAFPIVRRVFGSLIANDLVSVQPMSLPSGLIFFMDFQYNSARIGGEANDSLYGGNKVGHEITGGVDISTPGGSQKAPYGLSNGYSSPTGSATCTLTVVTTGLCGDAAGDTEITAASIGNSTVTTSLNKLCQFDPDLSGSSVVVCTIPGDSEFGQLNRMNLVSLSYTGSASSAAEDGADSDKIKSGVKLVRRLTRAVGRSTANANDNPQSLDLEDSDGTSIILVFTSNSGSSTTATSDIEDHLTSKVPTLTFAINDNFNNVTETGAGRGLGAVVGAATWGLEGEDAIPEIDIKIDSVAVTAMTKKLKAKWTPELGQDLNAYHNLDAEVELTSILSEQIALEIDREILEDLVKGATAGTYYWSRRPGRFLTKSDGLAISALANESLLGADFTGTVSEWYETLIETINDVSAQIHRKTLRGGANFVVCSPEVANIMEFTAGFRANVTGDSDKGTVGAVNVGSLSKKWDVYVDPYFPRNLVLIGRKGGSFLESGYVYAPYVPLQVTPTIFGVEDFVPRKGVMTRYAKKMVRPDMYGLVIVEDLLG